MDVSAPLRLAAQPLKHAGGIGSWLWPDGIGCEPVAPGSV
jgi:hypothetical protein